MFVAPIVCDRRKRFPLRDKEQGVPALTWMPSSPTSRLTHQLITQLAVADLRYNVSQYGEIVKSVPCRLGSSAALDSAAYAFSSILSALHLDGYPQASLREYGGAIRTLRLCLDEPAKALSSETLCAIWLIWFCEVNQAQFLSRVLIDRFRGGCHHIMTGPKGMARVLLTFSMHWTLTGTPMRTMSA
jgi:hypothetical protein